MTDTVPRRSPVATATRGDDGGGGDVSDVVACCGMALWRFFFQRILWHQWQSPHPERAAAGGALSFWQRPGEDDDERRCGEGRQTDRQTGVCLSLSPLSLLLHALMESNVENVICFSFFSAFLLLSCSTLFFS